MTLPPRSPPPSAPSKDPGSGRPSAPVAFLVWGDKPYMPGVKVTLDLAEALVALGQPACALLIHSGPATIEEARRRLGQGGEVRVCAGVSDAVKAAKELKAGVAFSKDHIDSLRFLREMQTGAGVRTVAFTSGFYGLETLRPPSRAAGPSPGPGLRKYLPFHRVTRRYRELLGALDGTVAISLYCEMLLELLFAIRPLGVVYPVVDPGVYAPPPSSGGRDGILVFVGPVGNRPPSDYLAPLRALPKESGPLHVFGSPDASEMVQRALGARCHRHVDLSTEDLVQLYRSVRLTYITSEWEGFGYVGPESLLCGTPVVAEVAQPWLEITGETEASRAARTPKELGHALAHPPVLSATAWAGLRSDLSHVLSPAAAGLRLLEALARLPAEPVG